MGVREGIQVFSGSLDLEKGVGKPASRFGASEGGDTRVSDSWGNDISRKRTRKPVELKTQGKRNSFDGNPCGKSSFRK